MTSISGLSSGLIQSYEKFQSYKSELTTENMFQMMSVELGGDGETITKDQLDTYIESAQDGDIEISDKEIVALTTLQEDWNAIAGKGSDTITFKDMENNTNLLLSAVAGGISTAGLFDSSSASTSSSIDDIDTYLIEAALGMSSDNTSSGATSLLQTLLSGNTDEKDDTNANLIGKLVNIIADYQSASAVDVEA